LWYHSVFLALEDVAKTSDAVPAVAVPFEDELMYTRLDPPGYARQNTNSSGGLRIYPLGSG